MSRSPSLRTSGFVFSIEVLIALVLFAGFIQISSIQHSSSEPFRSLALRESVGDALTYFQNSGSALQVLDSSSLNNEQKMDSLAAQLQSSLPSGASFRLEVKGFDANAQKCAASTSFDNCFSSSASFSPRGGELPQNKSVVHERVLLASALGPEECSIGAVFAPQSQQQKINKLFFEGEKSSKLFFASAPDINIFFGVNVNPSSTASCDQNIRVDLNAWIVDNNALYGRKPADIMLVMDKSGSMSWDGQLDLTGPQDIFVSENYAFVADGSSGLRDINVLDPVNPSIVGTYNSPGTASGVHVVGNYAYLADGSQGLRIVNVANKSSPISAGSLTTIGTAEKVFANGNYAYVVTSSDGSADYQDFNVSGTAGADIFVGQNSSPNYWAAQSFRPTSNSIRTIGVYVKKTSSTPSGDLTVSLKTTDSNSASAIASGTISRNSITTSYAWYSVTFANSISVNTSQTYYIVLTTSTPSSTRYYSWGTSTANPYSGGSAFKETSSQSASDAFIQVSHRARTGLNVIDISNPASPVHKSSAVGADPQNVVASGNYAYFTDGTSGLKVVDVSNPSDANIVGTTSTTNALGVSLSGNYAYVADGSAGLRIINVSSKTSPGISGTYNTPGTAYDAFYYSDGNVYVSDDSAMLAINVSTPSSPALAKTFSTPYNYQAADVSNNWVFAIPGYSTGLVTFNILNGPKMNQAKFSAGSFVDYNGWKQQYDQLGLVSFSSSTTLDQTLAKATDANKTVLKQKINALVANGGTAIDSAITTSQTELLSARATAGSIKFEVLLTDGQNNNGSGPVITAAQTARDNNITIYTIGFGPDADSATLTQVANITGGKYYSANDQNALSDVFSFIAIDIGDTLDESQKMTAYDANTMIPVSSCDEVVDKNTGACAKLGDTNFLYYLDGNINDTHPWNGSFTINIPCNSAQACSTSQLVLPFSGTLFYYKDINGAQKNPLAWDVNKTLSFQFRDDAVEITRASSSGKNELLLDVNVKNVGQLSSGTIPLDFLTGDLNNPSVIKSESVKQLGASQYEIFSNEALAASGWIYASINRSEVVRECPGNNTASVYCSGTSSSKFYVVDVYAWN